MDYNAHQVARAEHDRMVRSVPPVSEFGCNLAEPKRSQQPLMMLRLILTSILQFVMR